MFKIKMFLLILLIEVFQYWFVGSGFIIPEIPTEKNYSFVHESLFPDG
jgi:hypothetical protein